TLLGERRECPATDPICEPLAEHPDLDLCHEDGGSYSWCQTSRSPERVVCPRTRTGPYTSRLCKDLGTHLRCVSYTNRKFTLFCADRETGERMGCPNLWDLFEPFDDYGRIHVVREKGVTWCVMGKPVYGEIFDPIECPEGPLPEGF